MRTVGKGNELTKASTAVNFRLYLNPVSDGGKRQSCCLPDDAVEKYVHEKGMGPLQSVLGVRSCWWINFGKDSLPGRVSIHFQFRNPSIDSSRVNRIHNAGQHTLLYPCPRPPPRLAFFHIDQLEMANFDVQCVAPLLKSSFWSLPRNCESLAR